MCSGAIFPPIFQQDGCIRDIGLMLETGAELGVPLPLTGLTRQLVQVASRGLWQMRICAVPSKVLEKIAGVEVKSISKKS